MSISLYTHEKGDTNPVRAGDGGGSLQVVGNRCLIDDFLIISNEVTHILPAPPSTSRVIGNLHASPLISKVTGTL